MADKKIQCVECGTEFTVTEQEQMWYLNKGFVLPKRCQRCRNARKNEKNEEQKKIAEEAWMKKQVENKEKFQARLRQWETVSIQDISVDPPNVLYIIGNGFDIMHDVKSTYWDFERTLGKNNPLRDALETYLRTDSLWSDFEEALGHLDVEMMCNDAVMDMWLDDFNAYDPDAQAADFFAAVDMATGPMDVITDDLPRRFRMWVESLKVKTANRPLQGLIKDGKVLNFNYTEFIEGLYDVSESNVCYIHGCRRKKQNQPKEKLILGHRPGAGDEDSNLEPVGKHHKNSCKRNMLEAAQDTALTHVARYDDETTKKCDVIIASHKDFFESLKSIRQVVCIGHSLSEVDWDYFKEIVNQNDLPSNMMWYVGCHGENDLINLERLMSVLGLEKEQIRVFET